MKETLETYFGNHYGSPKKVIANCITHNGHFGIVDVKACQDCGVYTPEFKVQCDRTVAFMNSGETDVHVLELELFLDGYNGLKAIPSGKKCDLLIYSEGKILFCDMTCSNPKYIGEFDSSTGEHKIGKRLIARNQIMNSINVLYDVPEVASQMERRGSRIALFAYRDKVADTLTTFDRKVVANMKPFGKMQEKNAEEKLLSDIGKGFVFTEVRYPSVYDW